MKTYYVYILTNYSHASLYIGVTSNLQNRLQQHDTAQINTYTKKYKINILVYYEEYNDITLAIEREKQLKKWTRLKKLELIKTINPNLENLTAKYGI